VKPAAADTLDSVPHGAYELVIHRGGTRSSCSCTTARPTHRAAPTGTATHHGSATSTRSTAEIAAATTTATTRYGDGMTSSQ
jgi:hypothetical protein